MGSYFEVRLPSSTPGAVDLGCRALDLIDALEAQLTVYRDDSEVSLLNAAGHLGPVEVERASSTYWRLPSASAARPRVPMTLQRARSPKLGDLSRAPDGCRIRRPWPKLAPAPGGGNFGFDRERQTVTFDREGMRINFGSIGKGYAIDRAAAVIDAYWWPTAALVHGGHSSLYALGSPPGRLGGRWEVALRNPFQPESPLGTIRLRNRGLGTSGSAFQQFEIDGQVYGHIIDPRTGVPAHGPASVTVLAPTAALADAVSTAFYILGVEAARAFIADHPEFGAVIVDRADHDSATALHVLGMSEHDFTAA